VNSAACRVFHRKVSYAVRLGDDAMHNAAAERLADCDFIRCTPSAEISGEPITRSHKLHYIVGVALAGAVSEIAGATNV
jgi:hypothetical protein